MEHPAHAVGPVAADGAFRGRLESGDDGQEGGFSGAGRSAQADSLAGREGEVEVAEQPGAVREPVAHVLARDRRGAVGRGPRGVGRSCRRGVRDRFERQDTGAHARPPCVNAALWRGIGRRRACGRVRLCRLSRRLVRVG